MVISRERSVEEVLRAVTEKAREAVRAHQAVTSIVVNQNWPRRSSGATAETSASFSSRTSTRVTSRKTMRPSSVQLAQMASVAIENGGHEHGYAGETGKRLPEPVNLVGGVTS